MTQEQVEKVQILSRTRDELKEYIDNVKNEQLRFSTSPKSLALKLGGVEAILNFHKRKVVSDLEASLNDINRQIEEL